MGIRTRAFVRDRRWWARRQRACPCGAGKDAGDASGERPSGRDSASQATPCESREFGGGGTPQGAASSSPRSRWQVRAFVHRYQARPRRRDREATASRNSMGWKAGKPQGGYQRFYPPPRYSPAFVAWHAPKIACHSASRPMHDAGSSPTGVPARASRRKRDPAHVAPGPARSRSQRLREQTRRRQPPR